DGRLLLQRRSRTKDLFPSYYCASASGHVLRGEDYAATAEREVAEELGVAPRLRYVGTTLVRSEGETEMTALFLARSDGPFAFSPSEPEGGEWYTREEVRGGADLPLTPAAEAALAEIDGIERAGLLGAYLDGI